jgi:beta-lactamase regulating signal transducer with metallopeptidase domain/DUF4097 and DUF4098 domain-containing protein YvlB
VIAELLLKVTLLLAFAMMLTGFARRASAAVRHLIWTLALAGSIALVIAVPIAPPVSLVLPFFSIPASESVMQPRIADRGSRIADGIASTRERRNPNVTITNAGDTEASAILGSNLRGLAVGLVPIVWLLGFLIIAGRCLLGHRAFNRLFASAARPNAVTADRFQAMASQLGVQRAVRLRLSEAVSTPLTSGLLRPVVILPSAARDWSPERLRIACLHELAHVARLDYLAQQLATAACALFWFHPLAWYAAARLRAEGECATDDRVLAAGLVGITYASHLIDLARHQRALYLTASVTVGMTRPNQLEGRVLAMLDDSRSRSAVSRRSQLMVSTLALCALIPFGGLEAKSTAIATLHEVMVPPPVNAPTLETPPVAVSALTATAPAPVQIASRTEQDSTFQKTVLAANGEELFLDLRTGGAVILHGWNQPEVRVRARLAGMDWRETRVELVRTSRGVTLSSDFARRMNNGSTSHEFELWVPREFDVRISSAGGGLTIQDVSGDFSGSTGGGEITIEGASGSSSLRTGGGNIHVSDSDLEGTVGTGGGTVLFSRVSGGLRASSGSGPVVYSEGNAVGIRGRVTTTSASTGDLSGLTISRDGVSITNASSAGRLSVTKAGGSIILDDVPYGGDVRTGGGSITIESASGSLRTTTGGGDVTIRNLSGDVDVTTGAGDVLIQVINADGREHSVSVTSGKGTIVLELPAQLDARFELETAYTRNSERATTITSDFQLQRSETSDWDDTRGTPRKYVRATGTSGSGRGLIKITTVNGDIEIRRR